MGAEGYPWEEWDRLRREAPVMWYEPPEDYEPFWSITKHADIQTISKRADIFVNRQRLRLFQRPIENYMRSTRETLEAEFGLANGAPLSFNDMDSPHHLKYRNITSKRFTPRAMRAFAGEIASLASDYVGRFARRLEDEGQAGRPLDLVQDLSVKVPTAAIFQMLGVPPDQQDELFELWEVTLRSSGEERAQDENEDAASVFFNPNGPGQRYLAKMIDEARERGATADDLLAAILAARVDGEPLPQQALIAYVMLLIAAGLDTTRHATTGGVHLLLEHPDQLARLVDDPSLIDSAVEEILRFTSPVIHFMRTAVDDFEIGGETIRKGESVSLWYPSANRDEDVFERPYEFDIGRNPNPHLAFGGYGPHFCIGAHFARTQLRSVFRELLPLLPKIEIAGDLVRMKNLHVGGYTALPVRPREAA
ncbi:MAG: cytochrome P450 [bacterium]|nr:cytochrome P450 [bacterium]